jgi:cobalamin biosynthesis Mg chelatase CobN
MPTATAMPAGDGGLPDADGDGVPDVEDKCPGTATGASVDASGCSQAQLEELKKEAIEELLEQAAAGMNLTAVLDAVTAGGSTDVIAVCADENDNPLPNVDITFKIDKQPGSGANLDGEAEVTKTSDAEGVAEAKLNVGSTPGDIVASATAEECEAETITVTVTRTSTPTGDGMTPVSTRTPTSTTTGEAVGLTDSGDVGGSGSNWVFYALVPSLLLAVLGGGALWLMRRRIAWPRSWPWRRK